MTTSVKHGTATLRSPACARHAPEPWMARAGMHSTQEAVAAHLSAENEQRHVRDNLLQTSVRETVDVAIALVDA